MAERRINQASFGNAGRLTYVPNGFSRADDCGWRTNRDHEYDDERLVQSGPNVEWFAASSGKDSPAANEQHQTRKHRGWLLQSHPDASLGNDVVTESAKDVKLQAVDHSFAAVTQFAIGEMANTSEPKQTTSAPLIVLAGGPIGNTLRFIRPTVETWAWQGREDVSLHLLSSSGYHETPWTSHIGVVRRIVSVVHLKRFEPVRWLIAQRAAETTVYQPEYARAPLISNSPIGDQADPSQIAPNPLFTLTKAQTGGFAHCDVAFNPGLRSQPPQLALIDEVGNWTVWDVGGIKKKLSKRPHVALNQRGTIRDGLLRHVPVEDVIPSRWHRVLWISEPVDRPDDDAPDESVDDRSGTTYPRYQRSSILAMVNGSTIKILDLETELFLPPVAIAREGEDELILDVHESSLDPRCFFVVTTKRLIVIGVTFDSGEMHEAQGKQVSIVYSTAHMRKKNDHSLKITVNPLPRGPRHHVSMVTLYSAESDWVDVFFMRISQDTPWRVSCHRDKVVLVEERGQGVQRTVQTVRLSPVRAVMNRVPQSSTHAVSRACFFQIFALNTDMSLRCTISVCSFEPWQQPLVLQPDIQISPQTGRNGNKERKNRRKLIRYMSTRFVVDDPSNSHDSHRTRAPAMRIKPPNTVPCRSQDEVQRLILDTIGERHNVRDDAAMPMELLGAAPFDSVYLAIEAALETESLPLRSFFEIVPEVKVPLDIDEADGDWGEEIQQLRKADPRLQVVHLTSLRRTGPTQSVTLHDLFSTLSMQISATNFPAGHHGNLLEVKLSVMRQLASELYMSRFGIVYDSGQLIGRSTASSREGMAPETQSSSMPVDDDDHNQPLSSTVHSSPPMSQSTSLVSQTPASQPINLVRGSDENDIALIGLYTGCKIDLPQKASRVMSMWDVGSDLDSYVFSIDKKTEITEGMQRQAKRVAKEARKRKRAETLLQKIKSKTASRSQRDSPDFLPLTLPVLSKSRFRGEESQPAVSSTQIQSRLPSSSAPQTMSQPVPGVFGRRPDLDRPKKKAKRKGGF